MKIESRARHRGSAARYARSIYASVQYTLRVALFPFVPFVRLFHQKHKCHDRYNKFSYPRVRTPSVGFSFLSFFRILFLFFVFLRPSHAYTEKYILHANKCLLFYIFHKFIYPQIYHINLS